MEEAILSLKGVNGQLQLYENKVVIIRKGALAKMTQGFFKGDKTIYLKQITGIQVKLGGAFTNGYIQITVPGGIENKKGIMSATQDENSVMFAKKNNQLVNEIKEKIEELQQQTLGVQQINQTSSADEIKKYKELFDTGVITEEEFTAKKKQLLNI